MSATPSSPAAPPQGSISETKAETKTAETKTEVKSIDDTEIGMFDQLFYHCVPLLGKYGDDYELLEPMLAVRIPQRLLASLPSDVSTALQGPFVSDPFEEGSNVRLPPMEGDYAFPASLRLKAFGRGVVSFTVVESQGPMFVGLSGAPIPFDPMVEVTLGNTFSFISSRRDGAVLASSTVALQEGQRYWVHLFDGQVCVGKGEIGEDIFLTAYYPCGVREKEYGPWERLANIGFGGFKNAVVIKDVKLAETHNFLTLPTTLNHKSFLFFQPKTNFVFPTHLHLPQRGLGAFSFTLKPGNVSNENNSEISRSHSESSLNNAWVAVTAGPYLHQGMAEIIIGGWNNTKSVVHSSHLQQEMCWCDTKAEAGQRYWVSVSPHRVSMGVGDKVGQNTVMWAGYPHLNRLKQICLGGHVVPIEYEDVKVWAITENEPGNIVVVGEYAYANTPPVASVRPIERPSALSATETKVANPPTDFFLVVHGPPPPARDAKPQAINVMPHTWVLPTLQFEQHANVTKNVWLGIFDATEGVQPLPARPARDRLGLNLGGPVSFGAVYPRIAVIHDRRFSPNNAQFDLVGGRHIDSFFLVTADEGESIGNGAQFNGPDEAVRGPRRRCVSFHVIVGTAAMKNLLFRPCNQTSLSGFLKAVDEIGSVPEPLQVPLAELKQQLQRLGQ